MMDGNEDEWISESDAVDESDDELILGDNPNRQWGNNESTADDEEVESEEDVEPLTFDVALPVKHAYLGSNLQEARGHTLMDMEAPEVPISDQGTSNSDLAAGSSSRGLHDRPRGQICQIPILPPYSGVSMALVPGQTLPMTLFHPQAISMLRVALQQGRTFGIVAIRNDSEDEEEERDAFLPARRNRSRSIARRFANEDYPLWDVGTTAEIYEFQGDDEDTLMTQDENRILAGFTLKAKGSQRFRLLGIHRQVDGNLLAKVQILPEIVLSHPLHECHIACLDRVRHELPTNPKVQYIGSTVSKKSMKNDTQSNLVVNICSLIKEKRKGDDMAMWERICEVKQFCCPNDVAGGRASQDKAVSNAVCDEQGQVINFDKSNISKTEGKVVESEGSAASCSDLFAKQRNEASCEMAYAMGVSSLIKTGTEEKKDTLENVINQNTLTRKEHSKGAGFFRGKDHDLKSQEDKNMKNKFKNRVSIDGRWCRKRDSALTAWPDWVYSLYDGAVLVKRMHQEFKALHLSKKRDKSTLLRSSLGFKSFEKGLDRSFPCLSDDPVELSFWVMQNLPLDDKQRVKLLRMNSAIQRLRWELEILEKCHRLTCCNCGQKIADQRHAFCMSVAGPQGTYVNPGGYVHEALTLSKARGLKIVTYPPSTEHSWFPGYAWSIVECSRCTQHMGWLFTVAPGGNQQLRPQRFWGLCRKSLVTGQI